MTCFSIQKSLLFSLSFFLLAVPVAVVFAQEDQTAKMVEDEREERNVKTTAPIVLELFTASDCTACILADRMLYDAIKDKQVIGLSCHIKDTQSLRNQRDEKSKEISKGPMDPCTFRQWAYESSRSEDDVSINIPMFKFNGDRELGVDSMQTFLNTLNGYHFLGRNKALEVFMQWKDKDTITISLPQHPRADKQKISGSVWLVRYKDMEVQKIDVGQTAGRVLRFSNIIQDIRHIGKWHGKLRSVDLDVAPPKGGKDRGGYVILVQEMMGEPMQAAGKLEDYAMPNDLKKSSEPTKAPLTVPKTSGDAQAPKP